MGLQRYGERETLSVGDDAPHSSFDYTLSRSGTTVLSLDYLPLAIVASHS
jgi:hypothetical protein